MISESDVIETIMILNSAGPRPSSGNITGTFVMPVAVPSSSYLYQVIALCNVNIIEYMSLV